MFRFGERRTDGARATSRTTKTKLSFNGRSTCGADNQDCFTFMKIARTKLDRDCRFVKSYLTENIQTLIYPVFAAKVASGRRSPGCCSAPLADDNSLCAASRLLRFNSIQV